jgi:hypothetical protein
MAITLVRKALGHAANASSASASWGSATTAGNTLVMLATGAHAAERGHPTAWPVRQPLT